MITLEAALARYILDLQPLPTETISPVSALNRVLAQPVHAETDLPRFDQSAMDGYAFRSADTADATEQAPVLLPITQQLPARGSAEPARLAPGTAARILTGAMLPLGADTMIPQERAERIGDALRFVRPCSARRNIRSRGEELRRGTALAEAGQRIGPGLLASLVNADVESVTAHRQPRIRCFVTGDEIRPAGTPLRHGEIHDSNGPLIGAVLASWGQAVAATQHLGDDEAEVRTALAAAFADSDLVISTGGASVGDKDYLPAVAESLGVRRVFWKVAQKPGKPIFFGVLERGDGSCCAMLALPGNPGAVLIGLLLHVRSALDVLEGQRRPGPRWQTGCLAAAVERDRDRDRLVRMQVGIDAEGRVLLQPLPHQDSHMLSNLGRADALVWIQSGAGTVEAGARLRWLALPD